MGAVDRHMTPDVGHSVCSVTNMSVAVWLGLIALAGLDAETGVVMLLYLDHAWEKYRAEGRMSSMSDLCGAAGPRS
jgi:hypothetical protein